MNVDVFAQLLNDIGQHFGTTLKPDEHFTCLLLIREQINVQLELDRSQQHFIIGANIGELAPGRLRELFLKEALRANGAPYPRVGTFAYNYRKNSLILFEMFPLQTLEIHKVVEFIIPFSEKALVWTEALQRGSPPILQYSQTQKETKAGMFGL